MTKRIIKGRKNRLLYRLVIWTVVLLLIGWNANRMKLESLYLEESKLLKYPPPPPELVKKLGPWFLRDMKANIGRGMNVIHARSGCTMAAWTYRGRSRISKPILDDCSSQTLGNKKLISRKDAWKIQANDTVHVPLILLDEFVRDFLPLIRQEFVLIGTQFQKSRLVDPAQTTAAARQVLATRRVLRYFITNPTVYAAGLPVSPFPFGLKPLWPPKTFQAKFLNPIPHYQKAFLQYLREPNKTIPLLAGYLSNTNSNRTNIPRGAFLDYPDYLALLAKSWYVLSPNGDRPECHRHYEAIGLGSVPITGLDPRYYNHLRKAPVVYNNTEWWDLDKLQKTFSQKIVTNRIMIFEEYWMAHVEEVVGRPLRWWDVLRQEPRLLENFALGNATSVMEEILGDKVNLHVP